MTPDQALTAEWPNLTGTTAQKLAAVNALTVAGPNVDVACESVSAYLALNLKLAGLFAYADAPPSGAVANAVTAAKNLADVLRLPSPPHFHTSDTTVYATLNAALTTIASDPLSGVSSADATALMALSTTSLPWWRSVGYSAPLTLDDLARVGLS